MRNVDGLEINDWAKLRVIEIQMLDASIEWKFTLALYLNQNYVNNIAWWFKVKLVLCIWI